MHVDRLVRIAPIVMPRALIDTLTKTAMSMATPMHPNVSVAWAARELVKRGCDVLESLLSVGTPVEWLVAEPPRGHRRSADAAAAPPAERREFTSLPPLALFASQVKRLTALRRRLAAATRTKVSVARTVREVIARGSAQREQQRQDAEALLARDRELLAAAGLSHLSYLTDFSKVTVTAVKVVVPYSAPGRKALTGAEWTGPVLLTPQTPRQTEAARSDDLDRTPQPPVKATRRSGSARSPRRKRGPSRRSRSTAGGDDDGDGGGERHARGGTRTTPVLRARISGRAS
jgi:hypothetical protein